MKKSSVIVSTAALCGAAAALIWQGFLEAFGSKGSPLFAPFKSFGHKAGYYVRLREYTESMEMRKRERMELINRRGQRLVGYYYPCGDKPSDKLAFIVHGYRASHAEAAGVICQMYLDRGFDVFGCDHIASGESEGEFISFDYYETQDCLEWLDLLTEKFGSELSVVLHGFSMGGATVMKMSDQVGENVKFIVEDSGFSNAVELIDRSFGPLFPVIKLLNRLICGFDIHETDVRPHLKRSRLPILFVHGGADPLVPYHMGEELYDMYKGEKDSLFIPGGLHVEAAYYNRDEYMQKLDAFIEKYISQDHR